MTASGRVADLTSVGFAPWQENGLRVHRPAVATLDATLVARCLRELGRRLAEIAKRARLAGPAGRGTALLVAGSRRGAGCSTVALALAAAAAIERNTVLVDGDEGGLSVQLAQDWTELPPDGVLATSFRYPQKHRVLAFVPQPSRPDGLSGARLRELREQHELVVIDGGAAGQAAERWSGLVDVAVLVCAAKELEERAQAWDRLEETGAQVLGVVENRVA